MEKKLETIEIVARDFYGDNCLQDSVGNAVRSKKGNPQGYVEIYEVDDSGNKKLVGKHNLVLYIGREWLAQRIVNADNSDVTSTKDEFITWFGLGDGGVIPGDPLDPAPPTLTDTDLNSQVMITATDSSAADYHVVDVDHPEEGFYKIPFDLPPEFEQDSLNDDKWLILKIVTTVGASFANDKQLSEAGLFTAESSLGGYPGPFTIFSRVTFPSIVKTSDRRLIFSWFLYV
ncbi:MAG: hypothetical protein ACTSX1_09175 [Candidatus Heimdallarchaeaceae archaeon]